MKNEDSQSNTEKIFLACFAWGMALLFTAILIGVVAAFTSMQGCSPAPSGYRSGIDGMTSYERLLSQPVATDRKHCSSRKD